MPFSTRLRCGVARIPSLHRSVHLSVRTQVTININQTKQIGLYITPLENTSSKDISCVNIYSLYKTTVTYHARKTQHTVSITLITQTYMFQFVVCLSQGMHVILTGKVSYITYVYAYHGFTLFNFGVFYFVFVKHNPISRKGVLRLY